MQTQTTQPRSRYSQYTVRLMAPRVWRTLASATQVLWPTFGNHRIYQLQPAETESAPKVPIYPHSAPKPKPKPKFGRPLSRTNLFHLSARLCYLRLGSAVNWRGLNMSLIASSHQHIDNTQERDDTNSVCCRKSNMSFRPSTFEQLRSSVSLLFVCLSTRRLQNCWLTPHAQFSYESNI